MKRRRSKSYKKFREVGIGIAIFFIIVGICVAIIFSIWGVRTSRINDKFDYGKVISHPGSPGSQNSFIDNVPVRVMSIGRPDRKANMEDLLEKFEFKNVGFSDCLYQKKDINKNRLLNEGKITKNCFSEMDSEIAHTLGYLESLKKYGDKTKGLFFLEDDLMILKPLEECQRQLQNAFDMHCQKDADMLYFEMGYEDCKNLNLKSGSPIVKAITPLCAAAIYFTPKGIDKVLDLCQPIFDPTDVMFRDFIKKGKLEAYISIPLVFHQDDYWGSDLRKERKGDNEHGKNYKPCGLLF